MNIKLKVNIDLPKLKIRNGDILTIEADNDGTPLHPFWRKRLHQAEIDKGVEVVVEKPIEKSIEQKSLEQKAVEDNKKRSK